ncbi:hypothetical protein QTN47_07045 [Danxiaibacter flavus]|uniref:Uncharacterized protein n=1 Tax=Danxiaibacter flavus TaxID=3049108 RepID=A0ABV3ZFS2_9BACT|nr:hypothetical protein QNM32_07045 [Chitinophagaceae bacterium DXS]
MTTNKNLEKPNFGTMRLQWITYSLVAFFLIFLHPANAVKIKNGEAEKVSLPETTNIAGATFSVQKNVHVKSQGYKASSGKHLLLQNIFETDNFVNYHNPNNPVSFLHTTHTDNRNKENIKAPALPLHKTFSLVQLSTILLFPNHFFW